MGFSSSISVIAHSSYILSHSSMFPTILLLTASPLLFLASLNNFLKSFFNYSFRLSSAISASVSDSDIDFSWSKKYLQWFRFKASTYGKSLFYYIFLSIGISSIIFPCLGLYVISMILIFFSDPTFIYYRSISIIFFLGGLAYSLILLLCASIYSYSCLIFYRIFLSRKWIILSLIRCFLYWFSAL
jgi:hypothetical protein